MNNDFKPVMTALFDHLVASAQISFTSDVVAGGAMLAPDVGIEELFPGLPVFGPGVVAGATIAAVDEDAGTITLSQPIALSQSAATFTTGFLTTGRRVLHWNQVTAQPALFLRRTGVLDEESDGYFAVTTLECEAWIYCNAGQDPDAVPDDALTSLEKLVRDSFAPDGDEGDPRFTLGGRVYWCRVIGKSDISPGDQSGQAIARIPIRITLP